MALFKLGALIVFKPLFINARFEIHLSCLYNAIQAIHLVADSESNRINAYSFTTNLISDLLLYLQSVFHLP